METRSRPPDGPPLAKLAARLERMRRECEAFMPVWRDVERYVAPGRGLFDRTEPNRGDRRDEKALDPTPALALNMLAAGMQSGMTSPSKKWFRVMTADAELADDSGVRTWCDDVERLMYWTIGRSNFYNCTHTLYGETAAFGTGAMIVEDDDVTVVSCRTFTAGEYVVEFGARGRPTAFGRQCWMTAGQIRDEFSPSGEGMPEPVRRAMEMNDQGRWFTVNHIVCQNADYREGSPLSADMPYLSAHWIDGRTSDGPLRLSGFREFPVMVPRWDVTGADWYGRGPGWYALGESKMLQEMRKEYLRAVKLGIAPPLWGPGDTKNQAVGLRPGDITYTTGEVGLRPIYQVQFDAPGQLQAMHDSRELINRTFYSDLFIMVAGSDNRDMTAREVAERHEEKMLMLGPVLEREETELLTPALNRVFMIMDRRGLIPPPPEILNGQALKFEYISLLAQAQQMVGLAAVERLAGFVGQFAAADPSVLDKLDLDECVDQYAQMLGAPSRVVRGDEAVARMRAARAQQAAQAGQMAEAEQIAGIAGTGAKAARDLGLTGETGGIPLD